MNTSSLKKTIGIEPTKGSTRNHQNNHYLMAARRPRMKFALIVGFLLLLLAPSLLVNAAEVPDAPVTPLLFALVPKQANNSFFDLARDGCQARAALIGNIECLYIGPEEEGDAQAQADIIDELIARGDVDGISISVTDAAVASEAIARAVDAGIPVVTFDSDAQDSERLAYVGTDNTAFGNELGKLLEQLKPLGGTYGIISAGAPNVMQKAEGVQERLADSAWIEAVESPKDCQGSIDLFYQQMWEYASDPDIGSIIPTGAWPFLETNTTRWTTFRDANPNITMVASETLPIAIELMNKGYVDGLVGQLPFEMGELSADTLLKINEGKEIDETIYGKISRPSYRYFDFH